MRYSYGSYVSEYTDLESLSNDFDSIIESFFNENSNFSLLIEADEDNKQSLWETIKAKFEKLIKFVKETIVPKVKQIFDTIKGKLITLGDSIDGILKSGKLVLGKDVNIVKADVATRSIDGFDKAVAGYNSAVDSNKLEDIENSYNKIEEEFNNEKNHYIAKAGDKVNVIELTSIKKNIPRVENAKNNINGKVNTIVTSISSAQAKVNSGSDEAKKIYDDATFGVKLMRGATKHISKYIIDGKEIIDSLQSKTEKKPEQKAIAMNK